jgi:hypothetical protein
MKVKIQIKTALLWEETEAVEHTFKTWKEVCNFAYRLAIQMDREIRVEEGGKGNYFNPINALDFLN